MCHILYLDDERIILDLGREYLETELGCKVDTTTSPDEAIALFTQNDYDCIISDYMMPDLSGVEFLKIVREKNSKIPFVFFTGKAELNVAIDAVNLGADFFLQKDPDPLLRLFELSRFITQSTTRYRKEIELEKREQLFRTVADYTYDWEYWTGIDGRFIYTSPSCERITGYSAQEFYNNPNLLISIIDPEDREIWKNHIIESEADNHPYSLDIRVIHKKGTTIWINHLCSAIYDEQGQFLGRRGSNRDITEKKLAEVEICESEKALKTIFDNQQAMMIIDASNHTIVRANQEALNLIGLPENDVIGKECHTFICPEGRGKCPIHDLNQEIDHAERILISHTRGEIPVIKTVKPVTIHGKEYLLESFSDISKLKEYHKKIELISYENQVILDHMPAMVWYKDTKNGIIRVNQSAATTVGLPIEEIEGKNAYDLFPDFADKYYADDLEVITSKEPKRGIVEVLTLLNGEHLWVQSDKIPLFDTQGDVISLLIFVVDITNLKNTQDALKIANNKLHLLSDITRHDILNQIQALLFYIEGLRSTTEDPQAQTNISKILASVENIERQIKFTRDYQDIGIREPMWQDIQMTIMKAVRPLRLDPITVIIEMSEMLVYADPLLEKVFYNLAENARRYGEKITKISFTDTFINDSYVIVCEDDGVGIPTEYKKAIFKREYFRNTGFGLNLSQEILGITELTISETGQPGLGARFEILVPKGKFRKK